MSNIVQQVEGILNRADEFLNDAKLDQAIELYQQALSLDVEDQTGYHAETYRNLGECYREQQQYDKALELAEKAWSINQSNSQQKNKKIYDPDLFDLMINIYKDTADYQKALDYTELAIKEKPFARYIDWADEFKGVRDDLKDTIEYL